MEIFGLKKKGENKTRPGKIALPCHSQDPLKAVVICPKNLAVISYSPLRENSDFNLTLQICVV